MPPGNPKEKHMQIKIIKLESVNELGTATDGELEMIRFNGGLINYGGRSLPF